MVTAAAGKLYGSQSTSYSDYGLWSQFCKDYRRRVTISEIVREGHYLSQYGILERNVP